MQHAPSSLLHPSFQVCPILNSNPKGVRAAVHRLRAGREEGFIQAPSAAPLSHCESCEQSATSNSRHIVSEIAGSRSNSAITQNNSRESRQHEFHDEQQSLPSLTIKFIVRLLRSHANLHFAELDGEGSKGDGEKERARERARVQSIPYPQHLPTSK